MLASTQAFVEATGLTFANTQLYMGTIMLVYMTAFVLIQYYQSEGKNLPRKLTKRLQEAKMKVMNDQMKELMALKNQIKESVQNAKAQVTDTIDDVRQQSKAVRDAVNNPMQQIRD